MNFTSDQAVFGPEDEPDVRASSDVSIFSDITKSQLVGLLAALGEWAIHAHNALVAFRERRFTIDEFEHGVRQVVRGHERHLRAEWSRHAWRSR